MIMTSFACTSPEESRHSVQIKFATIWIQKLTYQIDDNDQLSAPLRFNRGEPWMNLAKTRYFTLSLFIHNSKQFQLWSHYFGDQPLQLRPIVWWFFNLTSITVQVSLRGASAKEITRDALLDRVNQERELRNYARRAKAAALLIQVNQLSPLLLFVYLLLLFSFF